MMVALCGQVKRKYLTDCFDSKAVARRTLQEMVSSGIFIEKEVNRARMIRLNMAHAQNILSVSKELNDHYTKITDGHKFKMSPRAIGRKKERQSRLSMTILTEGMEVNGISLEFKKAGPQENVPLNAMLRKLDPQLSLLDSRGNPKSKDQTEKELIKILKNCEVYPQDYNCLEVYSDRIKKIHPTQNGYMNASEVKRHHLDVANENVPTLNINSSKSYGHIFGEYNSYAVYYIDSPNEKFADAVERRYRQYIENIYLMLYGTERYDLRKEDSPKGECIIYYENEEVIKRLINSHVAKDSKKTSPATVYSKGYCIDISKDNTKQFLLQDWRKTLLRELFTITEIDNNKKENLSWCDAIVDNHPAIELVSKDIVKIIETKKLLLANENNKLMVFCKKEDEEFIKQIYGTTSPQIIIKTI